LPAVTGSTPGKRAMLLRVTRRGGRRAGPIALLVRNGVLLSPLWLTWLLLDLDHWDLGHHPERLLLPVALAASVFVVGVWTPLAVLLDNEHRAPYERLTRTVNAAVVPPAAAEPVPAPAPREEVLKGQ
ncbi:RDD family protein, partial [Amycolatopsis mediterranei]